MYLEPYPNVPSAIIVHTSQSEDIATRRMLRLLPRSYLESSRCSELSNPQAPSIWTIPVSGP